MDIAVASHKILQMLQNGSYSDFKEAASKQYFKLAFEVDTLDPSLKVANGNGTPQLGRAASNSIAEEEKKENPL
jgi:hypothetical protein